MVVLNCVNIISFIWIFFALSDVLANITVEVRTNRNTIRYDQCGSDIIVEVKENSYITIIFTSNNFVNEVWCTNLEYQSESNITLSRSEDKKITTVYFQAVDNNEGLLNCTFLTDRGVFRYGDAGIILWKHYSYRKTYCPLHITIEYILQMTIYNQITNSSSIQKKDGSYFFKDGDSLSIVCSRPEYKGRQLPSDTTFSLCHRKTETNNCTNLNNNATVASITSFATELKTDKFNDQDDVICEFKSGLKVKHRLVTRLVLVPDEPPTIEINEITFDNSSPNIYEGTTGENVSIICRKNEKHGKLQWDYCKSIIPGSHCLTQENNGKIIVYAGLNLEHKLNNTEIKCVFTNVNGRKTVTSVFFNIKPKDDIGCPSKIFKNEVYSAPSPVQFIPMIMTPSTNAPEVPPRKYDDGNVTINSTKNEFAFNEILNFSCSACYNNPSIFMNIKTPDNTEIKIDNGKYNAKNEQNKKSCVIYVVSYKMNFNTESVEILCYAKKGGHVLGNDKKKLMRVEPTTTDTSLFTTASGSNTDAQQKIMTEMLDSTQQSEDFIKTPFIWVIVGVGTLLITMFIIITAKVCKSKKSDQEKDHEDVTYENLSNEVATPPPFPKNAKLEETYLKPADCRVTDNVTYALPYIETNIENLYSKPLPKSQRNLTPQYSEVTPKNMQTNEPTYAEIESFSNNDYKQITNKTEYATIKDLNPNYTNVFVNEPYVNTKDTVKNDDYAEPSYCEIGKLI